MHVLQFSPFYWFLIVLIAIVFAAIMFHLRFVTHRKDRSTTFSSFRPLPSNITYWLVKQSTDKQCIDTNTRFKSFFSQKNISLKHNDNIKQEYLGVKNLHLNRRSSSLFAKTLFEFIEQNWIYKNYRRFKYIFGSCF